MSKKIVIKPGTRFGRLVVIRESGRIRREVAYLCECDCGQTKVLESHRLRSGVVKSCGCYMNEVRRQIVKENGRALRKSIEPGTRFGRLVVIKESGINNQRRVTFLCKCDCGTERILPGNKLRTGATKSCGCITKKHGLSHLPEYKLHLKRIRRHRDRGWTFEMEQALEKLQPRCVVCGSTDRLAVDHVVPFIKGGKLEPGNACILCKSCNSTKHDRDLDELPLMWHAAIALSAQHFSDMWTGQ